MKNSWNSKEREKKRNKRKHYLLQNTKLSQRLSPTPVLESTLKLKATQRARDAAYSSIITKERAVGLAEEQGGWSVQNHRMSTTATDSSRK